jgi:hypothetical protein
MYDVIVIGSGPSGLMSCIMAASNNKKVLLLEKNAQLGKKLLLTGGGRCNLTNLKDVQKFINEIPVNSKLLYSTLNNFGPLDIYNYFENLGVEMKIEDNDRVFPKADNSKVIVQALEAELNKKGVNIIYNCEVENIILENDYKKIISSKGNFETKKVIIAMGGASYPQTGSNGSGYKIAKSLNQPLTKLYPAETFLLLVDKLPLAGITLDEVEIILDKNVVDGSLLFTHSGLSGPATFKISEYVYEKLKQEEFVNIKVNILPNKNKEELLNDIKKYDQKKEIKTWIRKLMPNRLSDYILNFSGIDGSKKIAIISNKEKQLLIDNILTLPLRIKKTGSIEQSIVTGGGVDLKYINTKTMESTLNSGIYFVGELLDFHGPTGGYNITIALSTGYTAGINI